MRYAESRGIQLASRKSEGNFNLYKEQYLELAIA